VNTNGPEGHRDHREHRAEEPPRTRPEAPYAPDADGTGSVNSNDAEPDVGPKTPMPPMHSATPQQSTLAKPNRPRWRKRI
jgi:hypothetical protein